MSTTFVDNPIGVSPITNAVLVRSLFNDTMLGINSGYPGAQINWKLNCSSRISVFASTAAFIAATIIARCAWCPA